MKILITTGIFPPDIGGPASYVPQIASYFSKQGIETAVLTLSDIKDYEKDKSYPFKVKRIPRKLNKLLRIPLTIKEILTEGKNADIIYGNGIFLETGIAGKLSGKKVILKIVGDIAWERACNLRRYKGTLEDYLKDPPMDIANMLYRAYRNFSASLAHKVIVPSFYLKKVVQSWGVEEKKIEVIYNAVKLPKRLKPVQKTSMQKGKIKIATVCRLVPWKGVDGLIKLTKEVESMELQIFGDGPLKEEYKNLAFELGVSDRVHFMGRLEREKLWEKLLSCDIFILNSSYEGLPHIVIEAMALGTPVMASNVGGTPEVVKDGETGMLFEYNNIQEMKEKLLFLVENPTFREKLCERAKKFVEENFSFEKMMKRTMEVLFKT